MLVEKSWSSAASRTGCQQRTHQSKALGQPRTCILPRFRPPTAMAAPSSFATSLTQSQDMEFSSMYRLIKHRPGLGSSLFHSFKMPQFTLYGARSSTNTDHVRLTFAEASLTDYDLVLLNLQKAEQKVGKLRSLLKLWTRQRVLTMRGFCPLRT
ncbi:hypothetical protein B0T26DRAFT_381332 [Lasiosphaeria miniovina]|uniref:Uncharacterized protein n=1 Tax=Lasiosphaeria miniovina TaxID=1954250 RepID=A0AA40DUR9_9PEZI|nr:uncharacterized protein B0T26DRAFT_381332 [Lasiosphaeria miniovina]KAK0713946.1 hypothetical protein B0T26DRAFT_381332 [Lasiosphaeria miniovina]